MDMIYYWMIAPGKAAVGWTNSKGRWVMQDGFSDLEVARKFAVGVRLTVCEICDREPLIVNQQPQGV